MLCGQDVITPDSMRQAAAELVERAVGTEMAKNFEVNAEYFTTAFVSSVGGAGT